MVKRKNKMVSYAEKFAMTLLCEATGGKLGPDWAKPQPDQPRNQIPFAERRALLDSLTKVISVGKRVEPEGGGSALDYLKGQLNASDDGNGNEDWRGGASRPPATAIPSSNGHDADEAE